MSDPNQQSQDDGWERCPAGEISGMVDRLQSQRQKTNVAKSLVAMTSVLLAVAVWFFMDPIGQKLGHIGCADVCRHANAYKDGSLRQADPNLFARIEKHLETCTECSKKLLPQKTVSGIAVGVPNLIALR